MRNAILLFIGKFAPEVYFDSLMFTLDRFWYGI